MSFLTLYLTILMITLVPNYIDLTEFLVDTKHSKVWGPGLIPHKITMPARYFFIQAVDNSSIRLNLLKENFDIKINGLSNANTQCRIWTNVMNREDGLIIVRYKIYEPCIKMTISIKYNNQPIAESPYIINDTVYPDKCVCPLGDLESVLYKWDCGTIPFQINQDLNEFNEINWDKLREYIIAVFDRPHSISLCHYIIKSNKIHRKCYGKYIGFNMFMDNILASLSRKVFLPNLEFFVNLGDWPLASKKLKRKVPILSWCGNKDSYDMVLPTYDLTESTLENMGRVMLDMLAVQGNADLDWYNRLPQLFWRGRDSNKHRLDLILLSRKHPELFNVSITNFFFYKNEEHIYGPKTDYVSFFKFFEYKYQLAIDGTVASYRMPYLLGGGSLIFKQKSDYYEHFYHDLKPYFHYIPVHRNLSDLVEKIEWAKLNDDEAFKIAKNGRDFAHENLLPKNIFCYHMHLFNELSKRVVSDTRVFDDMEQINDAEAQVCNCNEKIKDEL